MQGRYCYSPKIRELTAEALEKIAKCGAKKFW
jgi:hypothetical protein